MRSTSTRSWASVTDERENPKLSDERIDDAPAAIRKLFQEYNTGHVIDALSMVGLNAPPNMFSEKQIEEGAEAARKILDANARRRIDELLNGPR